MSEGDAGITGKTNHLLGNHDRQHFGENPKWSWWERREAWERTLLENGQRHAGGWELIYMQQKCYN